jgi:serine/threonine-protein kinase RsbW
MHTRVAYAEEPTVSVKFCLVFPHEALSVPVMRHVLGDTLRGLGADEDGVADLLLAVTEACTNVLRHGGPGRSYEIVANVGRGGCLVEVVNSGRGIAPGDIPGAKWPVWLVPSGIRVGRRTVRPLSPARARRRHERKNPDDVIAMLPESGRGLAIMKACVDDVTLSSAPEQGTVVSLQKRIAWRNDAPLARLPAGALRDAG